MASEQQLKSLLTQELSSLEQLLLTLQQESDALISSDIKTIEAATAAKNEALTAQSTATLSRQRTLPSNQNNANALRELISTCENATELTALADQLNLLAQQCHNSNRTNGKLINQKQQQAQNALNIIRQSTPNPTGYSNKGDTLSSQATRSLGKA